MKTLVILGLMWICSLAISFGQTPLDPPSITTHNAILAARGDSTINFSDTSIFAGNQSEFMFGHQWYNALSGVNKRLYMNCYTANHGQLLDHYALNFYRFPRTYDKTTFINYDLRGGQLGYCYSLQIDPEAPTYELDAYFQPNSGDTLGAIYGFRHKEGGSQGTGLYANRYTYIADSGRADTGRIILSSPIGTETLQRLYGNTDPKTNGTHWYLSVNLRRLNALWDFSSDTNDVILSIKIPMRYRFNSIIKKSRAIIFDSISSRYNGLSDKGYYTRGGWMENHLTPANDSIFVIRRSMLPMYSDTCDITLSAFFRATLPDSVNPPFRDLVNVKTGEIDSLSMEVRYFGNCDIAIDWLRLETPETRALFRGEKDTAIATIVSNAFKDVTNFRDTIGGMPRARLWRFYITDEPGPLLIASSRYYLKLLDGYAIVEGSGDSRYTHSVSNQPTFWGSTSRFDYITKAPFIKYVIYGAGSAAKYKAPRNHTFGFKGGWQYTWNPIDSTIPDSIKPGLLSQNFQTATCDSNRDGSAYEKCSFYGEAWRIQQCFWPTVYPWVTSMNGFNSYVPPDEAYNVLTGDAGLLGSYEYSSSYLRKGGKAVLFSSKPWLSNIWIASEWFGLIHSDASVRPALTTGYSRAQTGEEMRLYCWNALILGAKGLMYDNFDDEQGEGGKLLDTTTNHGASSTWLRMSAMGRYEGLSDSYLKNDSSGQFLLQSDKSGSDFILHGDSTRINQYVNFDSSAYALGVSPNRIYCGRKSVRLEVMKVHDRVNSISSTLMRLDLQGWYSKGHRSYYIVRDNDTSYLTKFLRLDSGYLKTRPFNRDAVEGWDSTFCEITVHKDTNIPMDSIFYVGVLNRRTNPLIRTSDTSQLQFFTTAEFDSLTLGVDTAWRNRRFKQGGSRELSLPFNYKDANGRYALLRVSELGGGIDTVIGQDRAATIKLLPGEGKMLKVQILRPNEVAGDLGYSNQTKICTYPKMSHATGKWKETDTLVHYMTYVHAAYNDTSKKTGVYFRKSKPATQHMNTAAIQWDNTEYFLSKNTYHDGYWFYDCDSCNFPALVTRFDSLTQEYRSYVVYGCVSDYHSSPTATRDYQYIMESIVRVKDDSVIGDYYGRSRAVAEKRDMAVWGTPMINASDSVNFYCWSDAGLGIVVAWKKPDTNQFRDYLHIHWATGCTPPYSTKNPSMNPYSRYMNGEHENDCGLVWQEYAGCFGGYKQIFYTRLYFDNGHFTYGLAPTIDTTAGDSVFFNSGSTIFYVSSHASQSHYTNAFPVINRDLHISTADTSICDFDSYFSGYKSLGNKFDKVYWQSENFEAGVTGLIKNRLMWLRDTMIGINYIPSHFNSSTTSILWDANGRFLDQPVVSAGEGYKYNRSVFLLDYYNCFNLSERALNLNFRSCPWTLTYSYPFTILKILDSLASIHHFPQYLFENATEANVTIVDGGRISNAHLAERGSIDSSDWQRNHRIYNRQDQYNISPRPAPVIRSSGQYFFKTSETQAIARQFFSFGDDSLSFGVSSVVVGEQEYSLKAKSPVSPFDFMKSPDTLSTDWFNVDNIETMDVITAGTSPDRMSVWLERQSDGATWDVPLDEGEQMKIARQTVELTNGDDENYRVRICSQNNSLYRPETAITQDGDGTSFGKSSGKEFKQINLGNSDPTQTVFVYPNPARDEVNLIIKGTDKSEVIIVSAIGGEAVRFFTDGGKTVTVNTSTFPSGMYVVRVRRGSASDVVVPFVVFR
ncbi:MAG: T9SS type A sorting domain-containing protein [Ignavibacteriae bacterium]|nr:T9SS type A sorting domain-containing protein [Ignavibacteriota bacterium]